MTEPEPLTDTQYYAICRHFLKRGVMHKATRMARLTELAGRPIGDYRDLTRAEGWHVEAALRKWAHGLPD